MGSRVGLVRVRRVAAPAPAAGTAGRQPRRAGGTPGGRVRGAGGGASPLGLASSASVWARALVSTSTVYPFLYPGIYLTVRWK